MQAKLLSPSLPICAILVVSALISIGTGLSVQAQTSKKSSGTQAKRAGFSGTYANLKPAQRSLVDEWVRQYNELTKENVKPENYDELPLSVRTTFEAVTHALMTTKLTDTQGRSMGTALDVVSYLEEVHGKIPEASGDLQFRIYVALKPTALQTLEDSREFKRGKDNTVYHKGYPINYRQQGGVPSIQISCSTNGKRADIDVDYRSSKFPVAAVNGHLSSANSDVRVGNNYDKHVNRWTGFAAWWKSIFGLPLKEVDLKEEAVKEKRGGSIPKFPRSGKGKPEEAIYDYLNSWLVEQQPNQALAYLSPKAYSCIDQIGQVGQAGQVVYLEKKKINPGLVPYYLLGEMKKVNRAIAKPARLAEVAESIAPTDPALKRIDHPHRAEFDVFETPDDIAFYFECANRNGPREATVKKPERKYGKYYGASMRLKTAKGKGTTLVSLWAKEGDYWKLISWEVDPDSFASRKALQLAAAAGPEAKIERVTGDPGLITAVKGYFDAWFVRQEFNQVLGYISPQCLQCVNLYLGPGEKAAQNWTEAQQKLLAGMKRVSNVIGKKSDLAEAIRSITPAHPALKLVTHSQEQAFTLVSLPDEIARDFDCRKQVEGARTARKVGDSAVYGNYYGALFELNIQGTPAALKLLWNREKGQWKIIAYSIEVP